MESDRPRSSAPETQIETPSDSPSKTQRKREMHELQALGEALAALTPEQASRLQLPEPLHDAIELSRRITRHEARRRHMQYVGKLMRQVDADSLRAQLDEITGQSKAAVVRMHRAEHWRDRLLADDQALTEYLKLDPQADAQWLRATIRAARHDRQTAAPPKHQRALYRWLHERLGGDGSTPSDESGQ